VRRAGLAKKRLPSDGQQDAVGAGDAVDQCFRARPVPGLAPVAGLELD